MKILLSILIILLLSVPNVWGASTDATIVPVKNQAFRVSFPILDNDGDPVTGAAGLDTEISCDAAGDGDATNEATEIATSSGMYYLDLTSGEMNCDTVSVKVQSTTTDSKDTMLVLYPWRTGDLLAQLEAITHTSAVVPTVSTLTGHTAQTGDSYLGATAHANIVNQYDTTGLTGDTFPSTQSQLSNISNVGSAVNTSPASVTLTTGTQSSGTYASTAALDGTNHEHTDDTGAMELYYEFTIGAGIPSSVTVTGYLNGNNDSLDVFGYDWIAPGWVQIGTLSGKAASTNEVNSYDLFTSMVGTNSNIGKVRIRFYAASGLTTATLAIDQMFTSFSLGTSIYDGGSIWIDTNLSNTNTVVGIDGVSTNPVSTIAAANTLATALNLNRFSIAPNSTITLAASQVSQVFYGHDWTLALGGQDISNTHFHGPAVSGTGTTPTGEVEFEHAHIGTVTIGEAHFQESGLSTTLTLSAAGDYACIGCYSEVAGTGSPSLDFGAAVGNTNVSFRNYSGGIQVEAMGDTGTDTMSLEGNGQFIEGTSTGGTVAIRGNFTTSGITNLTLSDDARYDVTQVQSGLATEAKQDTAQTDLDTVTGADGTTLATTQGNYAPAKAGDSMALTAAAVDAILDETVDGTRTLREIICAMAATQLGISTGMGTTTPKFRNIDDDTNVVSSTMDVSFNRDAVTLILTGCN